MLQLDVKAAKKAILEGTSQHFHIVFLILSSASLNNVSNAVLFVCLSFFLFSFRDVGFRKTDESLLQESALG